MITFEDFTNLLNGTSVDFDNYYGPQCVDLVQFWSRNLGGPRFTGDAQDIFNQAGSFYTQVPNTPDGVPQKGDIVVWSSTFNGTVGHVGIATGKGDINTFEVFEQNDPGPGVCLFKTYDYNSVLGWLHPASIPQDQQSIIDQLRNERDTNWNLYQKSQEDLQKCQSDLSSCQSSTQSNQVTEGVTSTTTEIPVTTSTSSGNTNIPITTTSTGGTSTANSTENTISVDTTSQTIHSEGPVKSSLTLGSHIVWTLLNIFNVLKKVWIFFIGK